MGIERTIWIKTRFVAFHKWENAPRGCSYLRSTHRHEFHVRAGLMVTEGDRQVEFHTLKELIDNYISQEWVGKELTKSCEDLALELIQELNLSWAEISEDGECGATVMLIKD